MSAQRSALENLLDTADIVRDRDLSTITKGVIGMGRAGNYRLLSIVPDKASWFTLNRARA
jgi:hypothetical protein